MTKEKTKDISVVDFPIKSEERIEDSSSGKTYTIAEAICEIWNELREMREAVG